MEMYPKMKEEFLWSNQPGLLVIFCSILQSYVSQHIKHQVASHQYVVSQLFLKAVRVEFFVIKKWRMRLGSTNFYFLSVGSLIIYYFLFLSSLIHLHKSPDMFLLLFFSFLQTVSTHSLPQSTYKLQFCSPESYDIILSSYELPKNSTQFRNTCKVITSS